MSAQTTFTESAAAYRLNIGGNKDGGHAWADYDLDDDFDLVINRNGTGYLLRNDGGSFTEGTGILASDFNSGNLQYISPNSTGKYRDNEQKNYL
jgi:hypothetical protein